MHQAITRNNPFNKRYRKPTRQSRMDHPETLTTLRTQNTVRRKTKQQQQTNKQKEENNKEHNRNTEN